MNIQVAPNKKMFNFKKLTENFLVRKDIFKKYNLKKNLKLVKNAYLSGHYSRTVRAKDTYKHFLNTIHRA